MGQRKVLAWETGLFDRLDLNVGRRRGTRCLSQEDCYGQSARSCGRLGTRQKRGYKSPMKEFQP